MKGTIKERIRALEVTVDERTKTIFKELKEIRKSMNDLCAQVNNHTTALESRVRQLENDQLTRREKFKVYGAVAVAIVMAAASIITQLIGR